MRLASILLCFVFFGLAMAPCADAIACLDEEPTEISHNTTDHQNDSEDDDCSVFCVCSCCGASATFQNVNIFLSYTSSMVGFYSDNYSFNHSEGYLEGVWHPPTFC